MILHISLGRFFSIKRFGLQYRFFSYSQDLCSSLIINVFTIQRILEKGLQGLLFRISSGAFSIFLSTRMLAFPINQFLMPFFSGLLLTNFILSQALLSFISYFHCFIPAIV